MVLELTRLEAAASPAYLAASAASGEDEVDPAGAALALLEAVAEQVTIASAPKKNWNEQ